MTAFVLVHGAWHGGWCWRFVAPTLRRAGHDVYTPTLTGLGERAHLARPGIDLDLHVQDVVALLEAEDLHEVVLLGHSYGGMVVTGAADRCAARIRIDVRQRIEHVPADVVVGRDVGEMRIDRGHVGGERDAQVGGLQSRSVGEQEEGKADCRGHDRSLIEAGEGVCVLIETSMSVEFPWEEFMTRQFDVVVMVEV